MDEMRSMICIDIKISEESNSDLTIIIPLNFFTTFYRDSGKI